MNQRILLQILFTLVLTVAIVLSAKAAPVHNLQGLTIKDAQYMDKHGYNPITGAQFLKTCTTLKRYYCVNGTNWCSAGFLERRYLKTLTKKPELKHLVVKYNTTTCGDYKTGLKY